MNNFLNKIIIRVILLYQRTFSPDHGKYPYSFCKFKPTCSEYAVICFSRYNCLVATRKSLWRILRCHPFRTHSIDLP